MDSTVKACILSSLLGLTAAATLRVDPGPDCWYKDKYCDTKDTEFEIFALSDPDKDDALECYEECNRLFLLDSTSCLGFTLNTFRGNQVQCQLQKQECQDYIADDCFTNGKCKSGPNDCPTFDPTAKNCPAIPAISADKARWQCKDVNFQTMNPYAAEGSPSGTVCTQMCPSWKSTADDSIAQLRSTCDDGTWTATEPHDGDPLAYPALPLDDGSLTYPAPDAADGDALPCGCQPLDIKWDPTDDGNDADSFYYDPNLEEAAEFICTTDVDMSTGDYILASDNTCVLYCDEHYVATAKCVDGEWTGNPDWGFWCYNEPQIEDEVTAPPPV